MFRTSSAHEEGGERVFAVNTLEFVGDEAGQVRALRACEVSMSVVDGRPRFDPVEGTEFELPCELVLLALGFSGPEPALAEAFGVSLDAARHHRPVRRPTRPTSRACSSAVTPDGVRA